MTELTIGALAQRMQCQTETIRFYEKEGLLPAPARSGGNYRLYGKLHLERLAFIRRCRSLDMTLDEIRLLLQLRDSPAGNCQEVTAVLDDHVRHVADRIGELRVLQKQLQDLRRVCLSAEPQGCGILRELARTAGEPQAHGAARHVHGSHPQRARR